MTTTLVTGGAGFVGRHLIKRLVALGHKVWIVDNLFAGIHPKKWIDADKVTFIERDVREFFCWTGGPSFDYVFHLAAVVGGRINIEEQPIVVAQDIAIDSDFFNWVCKHRPGRALYASSSAAYPIDLQREKDAVCLKEDYIKFGGQLGQPDMCFTPETIVYTYPIKKIMDIQEDDIILSGSGYFKKVGKVLKRPYRGPIRVINTWMYNIAISVTGNHPFLVKKRLGKNRPRKFSEPIWIPASNIAKGDLLIIPIIREIEDRDIDIGFLRLAGIHLAEGSVSHKKYFDKAHNKVYFNGWRTTIWFNEKEAILLPEIKDYLKRRKIGFYEDKIYNPHGLTELEIHSETLANELKEFGIGARNKVVPLWIMKLPPEKQKLFLDAYLMGDGCDFVDSDNLRTRTAATASICLAHQLFQLFLRQGLNPSLTVSQPKPQLYKVRTIRGGPSYQVRVRYRKDTADSDWASWIENGYYHILVKRNEEYPYNGPVYNTEIDETHTYCVGAGTIVHNSYGWAKLTGEYLATLAAKRYGLSIACVRPFSGYGEDQDEAYPVPAIARRVADRENPLYIWGSGTQGRDFVHIEDCIDMMLIAVEKINDGSAVNIGSGKLTTFFEVAELFASIAGYNPKIVSLVNKPMGVHSRYANINKARSLGWEPKVSLEEGFRRVYESKRHK